MKRNTLQKILWTICCLIILFVSFQLLIYWWYVFRRNSLVVPDYDSKFSKINIIVPTAYRSRVGYSYVQQTFKSIWDSLLPLGVNFHFYAFESRHYGDSSPVKSSRFHYVLFDHLDSLPYTRYWNWRESSIDRQNRDWVSMMTQWNNTCDQELFVYLEDDFIMCQNSALQLLELFDWVKRNPEVNGVKFSYGGSGMILRCRNIPKYIEKVTSSCFNNPPIPLDWVLGDFWSIYSPRRSQGDHLHTFRYNLFYHIGSESLVGNSGSRSDNFRKNQAKCGDLMSHTSVYWNEQFNLFECNEYMISPCKSDFEQKIEFTGDFEYRFALNTSKYFDFFPITSELGQSCHQACNQVDRVCQIDGFPLVNHYEKNSKRSHDPSAPALLGNVKLIQRQWKFKHPFRCDVKNEKLKRICPCFQPIVTFTPNPV